MEWNLFLFLSGQLSIHSIHSIHPMNVHFPSRSIPVPSHSFLPSGRSGRSCLIPLSIYLLVSIYLRPIAPIRICMSGSCSISSVRLTLPSLRPGRTPASYIPLSLFFHLSLYLHSVSRVHGFVAIPWLR